MLPGIKPILLFDDFQNLHGAGLNADTAGDALGGRIGTVLNHNLHGAGLGALAAADALLLVDHVNTGLGVLGNGLMLADAHALAALDADIGLGAGTLGNDPDAGQIFIEFLIESFGAGSNTLQTCHAFSIFLNGELLHNQKFSLFSYWRIYYTQSVWKTQWVRELFSVEKYQNL